jgi:hypothetical protein
MLRLMIAALITLTIWVVLILLKKPIERFVSPVLQKVFDVIFDPVVEFRRKRHRKKLEDRIAAGHDRYFEELRSLQSYGPDAESIEPPVTYFQKVSANIFIFCFATYHIYKIIPENI